MTRQELRALYDRKTALFASEQALTALIETYRDTGNGEMFESLIEGMEKGIQEEYAAIAELDIRAADTLKSVRDGRARIGAILHYLGGMPWEIAAAVLRYKSESALRQIVYRGFREAGIEK